MNALTVFEGILSEGERDKLREMRELAQLRIDVAGDSCKKARELFDSARHDLEDARLAKIAITKLYGEAVFTCAEDDDDDWETAAKKADKLEKIEADYLDADRVIAEAEQRLKFARVRINWELREAARLGFTREGK